MGSTGARCDGMHSTRKDPAASVGPLVATGRATVAVTQRGASVSLSDTVDRRIAAQIMSQASGALQEQPARFRQPIKLG